MFKAASLLFFILESLTSFSQKTEIVFCADFSGSTNGMVKELQKTIWATVNQFQAVKSSRELSFGLVGYGRKSFEKEKYYSKVINPLGTPVNDIGYALVKLQVVVNGCDAYPQKALNDNRNYLLDKIEGLGENDCLYHHLRLLNLENV